MKKYILIVLAIVLALTFNSCEETPVVYGGTEFIQLSDDSDVNAAENSGETITTTIVLGSGSNDNGVTVDFTVTSTDPSRYIISPSTGTLDIPAGEFSGDITITPIDNSVTDGNVDITIELSSTNNLPVGLAGENLSFFTKNISILDDDCPFDINDFAGSYTVNIVSEVGFGNPAGSFIASTTLTVGTEPNTLVDSNFWDFGNPAVITFDPSDPDNYTVTLEGDPQFVYFNGAGLPRYAIQGIQPVGSFTTCDNAFQVNMELTREDQVRIANRSEIFYTKN